MGSVLSTVTQLLLLLVTAKVDHTVVDLHPIYNNLENIHCQQITALHL